MNFKNFSITVVTLALFCALFVMPRNIDGHQMAVAQTFCEPYGGVKVLSVAPMSTWITCVQREKQSIGYGYVKQDVPFDKAVQEVFERYETFNNGVNYEQ